MKADACEETSSAEASFSLPRRTAFVKNLGRKLLEKELCMLLSYRDTSIYARNMGKISDYPKLLIRIHQTY